MSPRYDADPTTVTGVIAVLDKGEYELLIGEAKGFEKAKQNAQPGDPLTAGIRYPVTVAEGPEKGAKTFYTCYIHTPESLGFAKQFIMTANGFPLTKEGEKAFNEKNRGGDWSMDPSSGGVGDMWREVTGKRVIAVVDTQLAPDGVTLQQKWIKFRPLSA